MPSKPPRIFPWPWPVYRVQKDGLPVEILQGTGERDFFCTTTGMATDYDGGIGAYHLPAAAAPYGRPPALDDLRNASNSGRATPPPAGGNWPPNVWPQLVINTTTKAPYTYTHNGDSNFCVSRTTLSDPNPRLRDRDTAKWVDAVGVPYIVLPFDFWHGRLRVGDLATVYNEANGSVAQAIFADSGPKGHIGEGSAALRHALNAHDRDPITWVIYPGSIRNPRWPVPATTIDAEGRRRFTAWGGALRIADRLVDLLQLALDGLTVGGQPPPPLAPLQDSLNSVQVSLRASKGIPYPQMSGGPANRVQVFSDRDEAIAELKTFIDQVNALAGKPLLRGTEGSLRGMAERARTALAVPD